MQLALADWIVIAFYFVAVAAIGIVAGLRVKDSSHYFLGGRGFGRWLMIGQSFGVGTHAERPVSLAGAVSQVGISGIWYQWKNLFATPFYWLFAPLLRRIRRTTTAEMTEDRYGRWMSGLYIVFALVFFTIGSAAMLKGGAKVISQAAGGEVGADQIIVAMTVAFIAYSFIGGLVASAWTDFFQGFLIIVLSFMLIPLGWGHVGGLAGMKAVLGPEMFSLATPQGIGLWYIAMLTLNGLVGILAQPHQIAAVGSGRDERACREGFFWGNYVKRVCTVGWAIVGLMVAALLVRGTFGIDKLADPEQAFGFACRHLLFPGALGLLIACVLAANMSTASAFMVSSGALFTEGLYRRHIAPGRPDSHYLLVGRLSGFVIAMLGVLYAFFLVDKVLHAFLLTETMSTYMGVGLLGGIMWPRANRWGALASIVVACAVNFLAYSLRGERFDHWDPDVFGISLLSGIVTLVVVSLLTPPEPAAATNAFFDRLQTPSSLPGRTGDPFGDGTDRETIAREAAAAGQQSIIVNLLAPGRGANGAGLGAYREDLFGFALGWAWVFALLAALWALFRLAV
jgi:Na+/proline symporter